MVICEEIGPLLIDRLQDQAAAQSGMVFVLFRKVGARLLRQWKHPDHANPGAIDEFATALSVMFGQQARLVQLLSALQPDGASAEMVLDLEPDRLEFLTAERADRIAVHLENATELARKWQPVVVPHMQTMLLATLSCRQSAWADPAVISQELRRR